MVDGTFLKNFESGVRVGAVNIGGEKCTGVGVFLIEKFRSVFMRTNHLEPLKIKLYQRFLPPPIKTVTNLNLSWFCCV